MRYLLLNIGGLAIAWTIQRSLRVRLHPEAVVFSIAVLYVLMIGFNTYLTALPIVEYNSEHILGVRIITWPIEDLAYLLVAAILSPSLFTVFLKRYEKSTHPHQDNAAPVQSSKARPGRNSR